MSETARILCVDDEPNVLAALQRTLSTRFEVTTATSGERAIDVLASEPPFSVVVSDMRMPGMDGAAFLARVRGRWPETVRILLTGQADIRSAIAAINEGAIFRYLSKPCGYEQLMEALDQAVAQYWFARTEHELLEAALAGAALSSTAQPGTESIPPESLLLALSRVVAVVAPWASQRAAFAEACVRHAVTQLAWPDPWVHHVAAALSQIGCVRTRRPGGIGIAGDADTGGIADSPGDHAELGYQLLAALPQLERVAEIIRYQTGPAPADVDPDVRRGAALLRAALTLEQLSARGMSHENIATALKGAAPVADEIIAAVASFRGDFSERRTANVVELEPGWVLDEDVRTSAGLLLLSRGHELTDASIAALRRMRSRESVEEPVHVRMRPPDSPQPVV